MSDDCAHGYDDANRLVGVTYPNETQLFQLDAVGNRTGEKRASPGVVTALTVAAFAALLPGNATAYEVRTHNAVDWLVTKQVVVPSGGATTTLKYDGNGNRVEDGTRRYAWDIRDTLTQVTDGASVLGVYDYDASLQRVKADTAGGHVEYVLDGKYVLRESGARTRRYHYGEGKGLSVDDGGGARWLSLDGLGSTSAEVTPGGSVTANRKHDAWGNYRDGTAPASGEVRLGYTGHQYDVETGLTYARARYYDSVNGVFLSRDSYEGTLDDAPSLHRYAYAHGNPLRFTDPDGRCVFQSCEEFWTDVKRDFGFEPEAQGQESGSQSYVEGKKVAIASHAADQAKERADRKEVVVLGEGRSGPSVPSVARLLKGYTGSGTGAGMSVAEVRHRNARGAGFVAGGLSTYSGWYEQYTAERARLDQVHTQGTALVAGAALLAVQPELAPVLMEEAGFSMGGAALFSSGVSVTTNASLEYGLTGEVTLEGTAMSVAGEAWTLRGVATEMKAAHAGEILRADAIAARQIVEDSAVAGGPTDYVTLYHGTSSNRAAKIVGSPYFEPAGFKAGADDAVFFAEDYATAEAFALESGAKYGRGQQLPGSFTVIELKVPRELAGQAGLLDRYLIGEYRGLPAVQMGATPYERILAGDKLPAFNEALLSGQIPFQRLKVR